MGIAVKRNIWYNIGGEVVGLLLKTFFGTRKWASVPDL